MTANKSDFFNDLSSHISEPIYLTDKTDEVNEEIKHNHWVLTVPSDIVAQTTTAEFLEFIQKVKDNYKSQLDKSPLDIDLTFFRRGWSFRPTTPPTRDFAVVGHFDQPTRDIWHTKQKQ